MIKAIVYSLDGYELHTAIDHDPNLFSRLQADRAVETWKAGLVRGRLAIVIKTVQSVERFLNNAPDGALVEITYELLSTEQEIQETKTVHHFARPKRPVLLPASTAPFTDRQIVRTLGAGLGSYIRVSYRLVDRHSAELEEPAPLHNAYAELPVLMMAAAE